MLPERFWRKVAISDDGCWLWTAAKRKGYGAFSMRRGLVVAAHRAAYECLVGPIAVGLELDHLCRTPACVNPAHLEPVDHRTNMLRGETVMARRAAQGTCIRGHLFDEANTYRTKKGRHCRTCRHDRRIGVLEAA